MEHIETKNSPESDLHFESICSVEIVYNFKVVASFRLLMRFSNN